MLRDIHIYPVLNGFIVRVGCQTVVFQHLKDLCSEVNNYYMDSEGTEKRYRKESINRELLTDRPPEPCPPPLTANEINRRIRDESQCCQQAAQGLGQGLSEPWNQPPATPSQPR